MRRVLTTALPLLALALAACPGKPKDGKCDSDKDCAAQQGYGKICVQGLCQECAKDTDCPAGFTCREAKCAPRPAPTPPPAAAPEVKPPTPGPEVGAVTCELQKVSFDFNEDTLRADARDVLAKDADCLKKMAGKKVVVAGHADERGTNEYNQHLGQRRAESVRKYLVNLGVDGGGLDTVSYGEEQPLCNESTEDCWRQNRRVELKAR
jgi:peptidoglycan-associated lipoprotein